MGSVSLGVRREGAGRPAPRGNPASSGGLAQQARSVLVEERGAWTDGRHP